MCPHLCLRRSDQFYESRCKVQPVYTGVHGVLLLWYCTINTHLIKFMLCSRHIINIENDVDIESRHDT